jgi:hypothetical protein
MSCIIKKDMARCFLIPEKSNAESDAQAPASIAGAGCSLNWTGHLHCLATVARQSFRAQVGVVLGPGAGSAERPWYWPKRLFWRILVLVTRLGLSESGASVKDCPGTDSAQRWAAQPLGCRRSQPKIPVACCEQDQCALMIT